MSSARYDSTTKELKLSQGHFTTETQGTQSNEMKLKKLKVNANSPSCIRSFPGIRTSLCFCSLGYLLFWSN